MNKRKLRMVYRSDNFKNVVAVVIVVGMMWTMWVVTSLVPLPA